MTAPPPPKPPYRPVIWGFALAFVLVGLLIFDYATKDHSQPPPEGGFDFTRIHSYGVVGAISGVLGAAVGTVVVATILKIWPIQDAASKPEPDTVGDRKE